jgi:hypothetical protein
MGNNTTESSLETAGDIGSLFSIPDDMSLFGGVASNLFGSGPSVLATDWAAGGEAGDDVGMGMAGLAMPFASISMGLGLDEFFDKGEYSQGALDMASGGVGAAGSIATMAGADEAAAFLGPAGAALGLVASGNKFTTDHQWWGVGTDEETGATHNRTGFERMEDDVSQAYDDCGGGVTGVIGAAGKGLVDGIETIGGDLLGGVASLGSTIAKGIGSIFSW